MPLPLLPGTLTAANTVMSLLLMQGLTMTMWRSLLNQTIPTMDFRSPHPLAVRLGIVNAPETTPLPASKKVKRIKVIQPIQFLPPMPPLAAPPLPGPSPNQVYFLASNQGSVPNQNPQTPLTLEQLQQVLQMPYTGSTVPMTTGSPVATTTQATSGILSTSSEPEKPSMPIQPRGNKRKKFIKYSFMTPRIYDGDTEKILPLVAPQVTTPMTPAWDKADAFSEVTSETNGIETEAELTTPAVNCNEWTEVDSIDQSIDQKAESETNSGEADYDPGFL
ncbi:hypothetical protein HDE_09583 [Halotydeus destructor]|nr:hypothetical protein HDE_09583 [Halotydeus destructor]